MKITGQDLLNSVPGEQLLNLAITKLLMEGKTRYEITDMVPTIAFRLFCALKNEQEEKEI